MGAIETIDRLPASKRERITAAIKTFLRKHNGVAVAEDLVDYARPINSPLHPYFTWDDTKAAELFRKMEARQILRVAVEYLPDSKNGAYLPVRVTTHLSTDERGYRATVDVLSDEHLRKQLIADALRDAEAFQRRYAKIADLSGVIAEVGKVTAKLKGARS